MKRFIEGEDRNQATLLPEYLDDNIGEDNPVRAVDVFVEELDLKVLGWTSHGIVDTPAPHAEASSNASGLTPPRWLWRRVRL